MIKNITNQGRYISIHNGLESNYINNQSGSLGVGNVRYNTNNQNFEIFDGINWQILRMGTPAIGLTPEAEELLDWAKEKRRQEIELERLAHNNRAIKIAYNAVKRAEEQLKTTIILSQDEE
jgi:hypothetical protein